MYSQNNEEQVILEYFDGRVGTFLDLGCNDGKWFSNTRALAERGWCGVLVDPSPKPIEKCRELYKNQKGFYIYEYAIGAPHPVSGLPFNGKRVINDSGSIINGEDAGLVSTFYPEEMERFKRITKYTPIEVKCFTWKTAVNRWRIKKFNMISMDVEGSEKNILPFMDLSETELLCIEWNGNTGKKAEFEKYLSGFNVMYTSMENLIYVR